MPVIVAFAGIVNPRFVAFKDCELALLPKVHVEYKLSFAFIKPGLLQTVPVPEVVPVPAGLGPEVAGLPAGHVEVTVSVPLPPWHIVTPVVTGNGFTVTVTAVRLLSHPVEV